MKHRSLNRILSLALGIILAGCGGSPTGVSAGATNEGAANLASHATEPRTADPTAASPGSEPISGSRSATLIGTAPGPASTSGSGASGDPSGTSGTTSATSKSTADPPKRISARHVLVQYMGSERAEASVVRSREQALAVAQVVLKRAKAGDDFARLAIEFSDEPGAGSRGGSLGRFGHGQMVPAFEAVAFKLGVGEISDIVETPFGFHVIQRTE